MAVMMQGRQAVVASRNRSWREDAEDMLLDRGCRVTSCRERDETLRAAQSGDVDLLLLDGPAARVVLPQLAGSMPGRVLVLDQGNAAGGIVTEGARGVGVVVLAAAPFSGVVLGQLRSWFGVESSEEDIDEDALAGLRTTFGPALSSVLDVFMDDAPKRATKVEAAIAAADWETARRDAHSLKSSTATFGMVALAADIAAFEHACKDGRGPQEAHRMDGLGRQLAEAIERVQALLKD